MKGQDVIRVENASATKVVYLNHCKKMNIALVLRTIISIKHSICVINVWLLLNLSLLTLDSPPDATLKSIECFSLKR